MTTESFLRTRQTALSALRVNRLNSVTADAQRRVADAQRTTVSGNAVGYRNGKLVMGLPGSVNGVAASRGSSGTVRSGQQVVGSVQGSRVNGMWMPRG